VRDEERRIPGTDSEYRANVGLDVLIAVVGVVMLAWPKPFVAVANYYRGGTGLSLGARTKVPPLGKPAFVVVRTLGAVLLMSALPLALLSG